MTVKGEEHADGEEKPTHSNSEVNGDDAYSTVVDLHACGICFQMYNDSDRLPKVLSCGHTNCLACLEKWMKHGRSPFPTCAVCRKITHKPISWVPNNYQLLQVLRRMELISKDTKSKAESEEEGAGDGSNEDIMPGITAVCEQIDEHMKEVGSLIESQLDVLVAHRPDEQNPAFSEYQRLIRIVQHGSVNLLSHWDVTKRNMLQTKKLTSRGTQPLSLFSNGDSGFNDYEYHYNNIRNALYGDASSFVPINDFIDIESDTPPYAYSDFSLFGSETSHETAVSVSDNSSQNRAEEDLFENELESVHSGFTHISMIDGAFGTYSFCTLCGCRLPSNYQGHRTHVEGRRHRTALAQPSDSNSVAEITEAMRFLGIRPPRRDMARQRMNRLSPLSRYLDRLADMTGDDSTGNTPTAERSDENVADENQGNMRHFTTQMNGRPYGNRRHFRRNGRNTASDNGSARATNGSARASDESSTTASAPRNAPGTTSSMNSRPSQEFDPTSRNSREFRRGPIPRTRGGHSQGGVSGFGGFASRDSFGDSGYNHTGFGNTSFVAPGYGVSSQRGGAATGSGRQPLRGGASGGAMSSQRTAGVPGPAGGRGSTQRGGGPPRGYAGRSTTSRQAFPTRSFNPAAQMGGPPYVLGYHPYLSVSPYGAFNVPNPP